MNIILAELHVNVEMHTAISRYKVIFQYTMVANNNYNIS